MEKLDSKHNSIFFHMGPGFHGKIEAHEFSAKYPHVLFADQPLSSHFSEIIQWAVHLIREQAALTQKPLVLLGHSFGAQIISAALPQVKDLVGEIRLLNSAFDTFDCFANLESFLFPTREHGASWWKNQPTDKKLKMIFEVAQQPGFTAAYWENSASQSHYEAIAKNFAPLNTTDFVQIVTDILNSAPSRLFDVWNGPVEIFYSLEDKLIQHFDVVAPWKDFFPNVLFTVVPNTGHHGLFESDRLPEHFFRA